MINGEANDEVIITPGDTDFYPPNCVYFRAARRQDSNRNYPLPSPTHAAIPLTFV